MKRFPVPSGSLPPVLAAASLILAGCNLAPRYTPPAIATPAAFKEAAAGVAWNPAQPEDAAARGPWWRVFGDAQLDTLEAQVAQANQNVLAAEANYRAARAAAAVARGGLFPTVSVDPSFERSRSSASVNRNSASAGTTSNLFDLPFEASYTIDLWQRVRNTARAASDVAQASAADAATALLANQALLAQDYFQLRALDTERGILNDTEASYRRALDVTTTLFQSGIDSNEDVARAQNQLDSAVAQATDTQAARAALEHAIAVLIGKPPADFALPEAPWEQHPVALPAGVPSELLQRRPDIAAAERRVAAANAEIGVARAAYFPNLTLGGAFGWEAPNASQWFQWPSRFWSLGPQAAQVLFNGGALSSLTDEAKAAFDQSSATYRQTVLTAFQAVEDNLSNLRVLGAEVEQQRTAVASSQRVLDLAMTRFQSGIDSYLNVVTAQTALLSNRQAAVQVRLRQMISSVSLVMALGGGWSRAQLPG